MMARRSRCSTCPQRYQGSPATRQNREKAVQESYLRKKEITKILTKMLERREESIEILGKQNGRPGHRAGAEVARDQKSTCLR
jgi:hypothetical protein